MSHIAGESPYETLSAHILGMVQSPQDVSLRDFPALTPNTQVVQRYTMDFVHVFENDWYQHHIITIHISWLPPLILQLCTMLFWSPILASLQTYSKAKDIQVQ